MQINTDLACELLRRTPRRTDGISTSTTTNNQVTIQTTQITTTLGAKTIGKPIGTYINIDASKSNNRNIIQALQKSLLSLISNTKKILVIGLGNDKFVADSLGPCVLEQIKTGKKIVTFEPNVFGVTGINSVEAIQAITSLVQPTTVIVVDSLVSASPTRIGTNYQICTSGIAPGSGISRNNRTIDHELLGVPVLAIGVPVCTIMTTTP
ncbi:MAG: GPR endopeptidase, partial [Clostridia bacterium]|nr:GPR endopeptidase [Clostridia bacterium]